MKIRKKIFLTGVSGFLGSHIARILSLDGHHVLGLIRGDKIPLLLQGLEIEYCTGDIRFPETYERHLKSSNAVIHTAALATFDEKRKQQYYEVNCEGTKKLLHTARKNSIERFIHTGTLGTLGVANVPAHSDETNKPVNIRKADAYIRSKQLAEEEVLKCARNSAMSCLVLSPTALIGAYDEKPTPIGKIILSYLTGKIHTYLDGGINLVDVEDAAQAFVSALDKGGNGQIYILGNENITLYDLFKCLSAMSDVPVPKLKIPFPIAYAGAAAIETLMKISRKPASITKRKVFTLRNCHSYCSSQKAISALNLPQTPFLQTLKKTKDWFAQHIDILR